MSDNLPAVPEPTPHVLAEVTRADTDSWIQVVGDVSRFAAMIAETEFVPKSLRGNAAATTAAIVFGREVGLPPMTALTQTHVIEGRPAISAEGMRALVLAAGHQLEVVETSTARCVMRARRRGQDGWTTLAWSTDDARTAGLLGRGPWKSYPRAMLQARCTTELVRLMFPDVIHGFRSVEELDDGGAVEVEAPAPVSTTPVRRAAKKAVAKKTAPPALPAPAAARPQVDAGPPLPGEEPHEQTSAGGASSPAAETDEGQAHGADQSPPADVDDAHLGVDEADAPAPDAEGEAAEGAGAEDQAHVEEAPVRGRPATKAMSRMLFARLKELGVDPDDREERLYITSALVARPVESSTDLTHTEVSTLLDTLAKVRDRAGLNALLDGLEQAGADQ